VRDAINQWASRCADRGHDQPLALHARSVERERAAALRLGLESGQVSTKPRRAIVEARSDRPFAVPSTSAYRAS